MSKSLKPEPSVTVSDALPTVPSPAEIEAAIAAGTLGPLQPKLQPIEVVEDAPVVIKADEVPEPQVAVRPPSTPLFRSVDDISELAASDPAKAMQWLQLQDALKKYKAEASERQSLAQTQLAVARETAQTERAKRIAQRACENAMHMRPDNTCAVGGQWDSSHKSLLTICVLCQKTYGDVGDGPGQLPPHIWGRVNQEYIGG